LDNIPNELDKLLKDKTAENSRLPEEDQIDLVTMKTTHDEIKSTIKDIQSKKTIEGIILQLNNAVSINGIQNIIKQTE
jgi:hypothetical protein